MNNYETVSLCLATLLALLYVRWQFKSWPTAIFLALVSVPPLYLSLERASQFLTTDATAIIKEVLYLSTSDMGQWLHGAARTTDTSLGLLMAILYHYLPGMTELQGKILLKNLHWLSGFALLLWIHHLLHRHFVSRSNKYLFFFMFIYTAFLLPTNNLALKTFNYDLLSMLFSLLVFLHILVAIKVRKPRYALLGIVIAYLAAQEKLNASPFLILALAVYAYLACMSSSKFNPIKIGWHLLIGFSVALFTGIISIFIVAIIKHWNVPEGLWESVIDPFVSWAWVVLIILFSFDDHASLTASGLPLLGLSFGIIYPLSILLFFIDRFFTERPSLLIKLSHQLSRVNIALVIVVFLTGVYGTYWITAYWAPYSPIEPGNYHPPAAFNGAFWHFGAASLWQHIISFIAYAYTVLVNAIPSVYWLCFIGTLITARILRQKQRAELSIELLLMAGLLVPLVFGLVQIPVANRYLNIGLLLTTIGIALKTTNSLTALSAAKQAAFGVVFATLLLAEVFPFRPLYAPFRPFWSEYDDNTTPITGKINPSWLGWGEETMLAGQFIEAQCRNADNNTVNGIPCNLITLYVLYWGEWLDEDTQVTAIPSKEALSSNRSYTPANYYVLNRSIIVQGFPFPFEAKPTFVISFRGHTQAWVYRFDQLQAAGYELIYINGTLQMVQWQTLPDGSKLLAFNNAPSFGSPPTSCEIEPVGVFYELWVRAKNILGCPLYTEPIIPEAIEMPFEKGNILSLDKLGTTNKRLIVPIFGRPEGGRNGAFGWFWQDKQVVDRPGHLEDACALAPLDGKHQPGSGIGQVWCQPEVFEKIGRAIGPKYQPKSGDVLIQDFEHGVLLRDSEGYRHGWVYLLPRSSRTYIRLPYQ